MRTAGTKPMGRFAVKVEIANHDDLGSVRRGFLDQKKCVG